MAATVTLVAHEALMGMDMKIYNVTLEGGAATISPGLGKILAKFASLTEGTDADEPPYITESAGVLTLTCGAGTDTVDVMVLGYA